MDNIITRTIPRPELLAQLAEECTELAHAALKLRRALTGVNPTPVTVAEAEEMLLNETADVLTAINYAITDQAMLEPDGDIYLRMLEKNDRWISRLEQAAEKGGPHGAEG